MTELLYQRDSYLKEFDARVQAITDEGAVILDRTAFYPGGGGQPYDVGELVAGARQWPVTRTQKKGSDVVHTVVGEPPAVGTRVTGRLNWQRRYQVMRTHTAMHILCGVIWRDYGASVTGGNMEPLKGRMVSSAILPREVAFQIPDLIRTKINLLPESIQEVRTVEIKGLDLQADGGTHVANTAEVGRIRVTDYKSKGKINKRIYVELEQD
jgi:misacylated tRNA(Ala) deacylase